MLKDVLLAAIAILLLAGCFLLGRISGEAQAPPPSPVVGPPLLPPVHYDPGDGAVVSLYNPDGRLLKFFELRGEVNKSAQELVFETRDGKRVHTNAYYILEGKAVGRR